jgi:hypothetical protein
MNEKHFKDNINKDFTAMESGQTQTDPKDQEDIKNPFPSSLTLLDLTLLFIIVKLGQEVSP